MSIRIVGKTELGNTVEIIGTPDAITMKRMKDPLGNEVNDNMAKGNVLVFRDGRFVLRNWRKVVAETFGVIEITSIQVT